MLTVVTAQGPLLERILDSTDPAQHQGLSRQAFTRLDAAQRRTPWSLRHQRRVALMEGAHVLASVRQHDLTGTLDGQRVRICGLGELWTDRDHGEASHAQTLVERVLDDASRDGVDVALLFPPASWMAHPDGFEVIPTMDVEIRVAESPRYGAPMTLVRGGAERDLSAITAMGHTRASPFRFHLDRDLDLVRQAMTRKRLVAGLGPAGGRQFEFVIAEEGFTAAAYLVVSIAAGTWMIEECGDRDPSGARVGAILQALIAREPAERRPVIRGWLPPGFVPPQVSVVSSTLSTHSILGRGLRKVGKFPRLTSEEVLYWMADIL